MFLVLTFCVPLKNSPYISLNVLKSSHFIFVIKISPCC